MFSAKKDAMTIYKCIQSNLWLILVIDIVQLKDEYLLLSQTLEAIISAFEFPGLFHSNANYENNISSPDTNSKINDKVVSVPQWICEL